MDASAWDRRYAGQRSLWGDRPNEFLVEGVVGLVPATALDIACGEGRNALWLARHGWSVRGVDFSPVAIARAVDTAEAETLDAAFEVRDLGRWIPPEAAFDLVTVVYLQLPADEMGPVVARAARAVKPGGRLIVVGHHTDNLLHGFGGPPMPEVLYTEKDLLSWCPIANAEARRAVRVVETDEGPREAIDAVLVATP